MSKENHENWDIFPLLNCCYFLLFTHMLAHSARLASIKQIWDGVILPYWKAPGTCKNNLIFPATNIRSTEKSWQYFYFSHVKWPFGVNILMHTVTIMFLNLITIFVVSWSDPLNKSPALWVYSVCVCMVLHWNLASLPKNHLAFSYPVCTFFSLRKKGTKSHAYFFPAL